MGECIESRPAAPAGESKQLEAAIVQGLAMARVAGKATPGLRDAVWELLLEAGDTLRRLPNRERGWLTAASRAHWPDHVRSWVAESDHGTARTRPGPASAEAIDRLDVVLPWLSHAGGTNPKRDIAVVFGLACGAKVASLRRRLGCGRRTVYDARDRGISRICGWLREESAYCRSLE